MQRVILWMIIGLSLCIAPVAQAGLFEALFGRSLTQEEKAVKRGEELARDALDKLNSKDYRGAVAVISKAIELEPKISTYYLFRGKAKSWLGDYRGWLEDADQAITLDPESVDAYASRAQAKVFLEDWAGVFSDYQMALKIDWKNDAPKERGDQLRERRDKIRAAHPVTLFDAIYVGDKEQLEKMLASGIPQLERVPEGMQEMVVDGVHQYYAGFDGRITPLYLAAYLGKLDMVKILIKWGADVNATPEHSTRETPLHAATDRSHQDVVEYLIAHGANPNARNSEGATPLHNAFSVGHPRSIAEFLVARGGDVTIKRNDGYTPLEMEKYATNYADKVEREVKAGQALQRREEQEAARLAEVARLAEEKRRAEMQEVESARAAEQQRQAQRGPSIWELNADASRKALKDAQTYDNARRNADYRRDNNCSGANCNNR